MTPVEKPEFTELSKREMDAIIRRNNIGRIAFSFRDSVDIRPIHYVWSKGWLFGRTSPGDKLTTLRRNRWVAFEIDETSGPFDWKSVVVRGTFYVLEPEGSEHDIRLYRRAVRAIRRLAPRALTDDDPVAFRSVVFGITIDSVTGRSSTTRRKR
jgi:nitroimidazol reductase NimA-like FMN-containing flavoprotein (pyridoxamine 5'-phosphate oxidase superfamily)